ncbi:J domain-containing protein [Pinisolibacter sp.]|uniref:J domain-containing protein n=1 Tax=Pinisolibacter sp. TaxID=2172024 RepID=UPI002FDC90FE
MKFDNDIFERIRIKPDPELLAKRTFPTCDWEGCDAAGTHPAPKGRAREGEYHHFCIDHVRLYNKAYNYFSGLADDTVAAFHKDAMTGHRPTWAMGSNPDASGPRTRAEDFEIPRNWSRRSGDPRIQFGRAARFRAEFRAQPVRRKPLEKKALDTLGLPEAADAQAIRARYKDLVKRHHPDANGGDRSSEGRLQEIIQAYKLLRTAGLC